MSLTSTTPRWRSFLARFTHWSGSRTRRFGLVLFVFIAGAVALPIWRAFSLDGLPDVGDPFDLAAFRRPIEIPDSENAFVLYAKAMSRLGRPTAAIGDSGAWETGNWSNAGPEMRAYLAANRAALDLWREGSERPRGLYHQAANAHIVTFLPVVDLLNQCTPLALLEAGRLESLGEMESAWGWYRAVLKSSRHTSHGFLIERTVGAGMYRMTADRLRRWAADPRVDAPLLRRALGEVRAINATTPPLSEAVKLDYWVVTRDIEDMRYLVEQVPTPLVPRDWFRTRPLLDRGVSAIQRSRVAWSNDRERSRRIIQLVYANWLAQVDRPPRQRARIALDTPVLLYAADPSAPPAARALRPEELVRALENTLLAKQAFRCDLGEVKNGFWEIDGPLADERRQMADLVVALAEELYFREHGEVPRSPQELVGSYLDALPDDYEP